MRVAFVTNFCPHYRVKTFETLARYQEVDYLFFSKGDEWYWPQQHGVRQGAFHLEYLPGFSIGRVRLTPALPLRLWRGQHRVIIKCIVGRFALPAAYAVARLKGTPFVLWTGVWMRLCTPFHRLFFPLVRLLRRHGLVPGTSHGVFCIPRSVEAWSDGGALGGLKREFLSAEIIIDAGKP